LYDHESSDIDTAYGGADLDIIHIDDTDGFDLGDGGAGANDVCYADAGDDEISCA
jgi:hypothetical protein